MTGNENAVKALHDLIATSNDAVEGFGKHKGWVDLEQRLRSTASHAHSKDDKEIIRECISGESGSLSHFDHALAQNLNEDVRALVLLQRTTVQDDLTYLQSRVDRGHAHSA
jgi:hypothetical protein